MPCAWIKLAEKPFVLGHTAAIDLCGKFHLDVPWVRKW